MPVVLVIVLAVMAGGLPTAARVLRERRRSRGRGKVFLPRLLRDRSPLKTSVISLEHLYVICRPADRIFKVM